MTGTRSSLFCLNFENQGLGHDFPNAGLRNLNKKTRNVFGLQFSYTVKKLQNDMKLPLTN